MADDEIGYRLSHQSGTALSNRRVSPLTAVGGVLALAGLILLAYGLWKANPLVFFGTREEVGSQRDGRMLVSIAWPALLVAAAMLAPRIGVPAALVVAAPGVVCALLVAVAPQSAYGLLAFLVLGPLATLTCALRLVSPRGGNWTPEGPSRGSATTSSAGHGRPGGEA